MSEIENQSAEELLELIKDWEDPNPKPVIEKHGKVFVVRDDLLDAGTKIRAIDFLISSEKDVEEWVFGSSPAHGYGQISLAHVCRKYGKKAVLFMAERSPEKYHAYQKKGIALGAEYHWVPNGMLVVTQKRARDYVSDSPNTRRLLPLGLSIQLFMHLLSRLREVWISHQKKSGLSGQVELSIVLCRKHGSVQSFMLFKSGMG